MKKKFYTIIFYPQSLGDRKKKTGLENFLMASLLLLPLMDSIIGYMWTQGVRESIVFKYQAAVCAIFFTTALVTTALSWKQLVFLAGLVSVGASSVLINKIFLKSFVFNTYGFIGICGIAFAVSIYSLIKKSFLSKDFFNRSIFYASWLYPMSILLLYPFKIGNQSYFYGEGNVFNRGFMGFHPSSNEINAILIVMLGYALFRLYTHFNWHDFLAVFMNFYAAMPYPIPQQRNFMYAFNSRLFYSIAKRQPLQASAYTFVGPDFLQLGIDTLGL